MICDLPSALPGIDIYKKKKKSSVKAWMNVHCQYSKLAFGIINLRVWKYWNFWSPHCSCRKKKFKEIVIHYIINFIVEKLLLVLTIAHNLGLCWWKFTVIHDEGNSWLNSGNPRVTYTVLFFLWFTGWIANYGQ